MKLKTTLIIVGLIIIIILLIVFLTGTPQKIKYEKSEYCYDQGTKGVKYKDTPNKICICDGEIIVNPEVTFGSQEFRCFGEITGYEYRIKNKRFKSLQEFETYCNQLEPIKKDSCIEIVEEIKFIENF